MSLDLLKSIDVILRLKRRAAKVTLSVERYVRPTFNDEARRGQLEIWACSIKLKIDPRQPHCVLRLKKRPCMRRDRGDDRFICGYQPRQRFLKFNDHVAQE